MSKSLFDGGLRPEEAVHLGGYHDNVRQSVTEQSKSKQHGPITSSDQTVPTKIGACDWSMLFAIALLCNTLTHFVIQYAVQSLYCAKRSHLLLAKMYLEGVRLKHVCTRQGQPKSYISDQSDTMDLKCVSFGM
jgi:hypothetical protein